MDRILLELFLPFLRHLVASELTMYDCRCSVSYGTAYFSGRKDLYGELIVGRSAKDYSKFCLNIDLLDWLPYYL